MSLECLKGEPDAGNGQSTGVPGTHGARRRGAARCSKPQTCRRRSPACSSRCRRGPSRATSAGPSRRASRRVSATPASTGRSGRRARPASRRRARCSPSSRSAPTIVNLPMQDAARRRRGRVQGAAAEARRGRGVLRGDRLPQLPARAAARRPAAPTKEERWKIVRDRLAAIARGAREARRAPRPRVPRAARVPHAAAVAAAAAAAPRPNPAAAAAPAARAVRLDAARDGEALRDSGPNVGVTLDAWHWYHSGGTVADILATPAVAHRPRPRLGRAADAARGRAGQHAAAARRRRDRSGRLLPGAAADRLPGRRRARDHRPADSRTTCRRRKARASRSR